MEQRFCEVCNDPLELDSIETLCDACLEVVEVQLAEVHEETECETSASVVEPSSSATPDETRIEDSKSISSNDDAPSATGASESGNLDLVTEETLSPSNPEPTKRPPSLACDSCGVLQYELKKFKPAEAREALELCESCFNAEQALVNHVDDPMQGKVVHPDESEREEIITMDQEDAALYNAEVRISMESPIEEVYARIALLEGKLQRAKVLLKASRTTLFVRIEHMKKEEREAEYVRLNERDAKKRRRAQPVSADGTVVKRASSGTRAPKRSKAQVMRENLRANGMSDEWIDEMFKKRGIE